MVYRVAEREFFLSSRPHCTVNYPCAASSDKQHTLTGVSWLHRASNNVETFYYQLMHIMLKNTELLKHSKIALQHVSVYIETIFRELQSVLG